MQIRQLIMCGTAACALTGFANAAVAQPQEPTASPAAQPQELQGTAIETVVVTATLRKESIQDTPVSVTALGPDQLDKLFARDLTSLTRMAPNVTIEGVGAINRSAAVLYSRGIGYSGIDQAIDPSVGVSVDGIFYPGNLNALLQIYDAASVEIDRGPQGTLFGKNTTGGVVQIKTHAPDLGLYSIDAYAKVGNYGRADFGGVVNIPINDTLALRLATQSQYSDGYVRNTYVDPKGNPPQSSDAWLSGDDYKTYRASLKWEPSSDFSAVLVGSYIKNRSDSSGGQNGSVPAGGLGLPGYPTLGDYLSLPAYLGRPGYGFPGGTTDPYTVQRNYPNGDTGDTFTSSLNMNYHLPWADVVSITGYMRGKQNTFSDFDTTGLSFFETFTKKRMDYFQQEVHLQSNDDTSPLRWVAGLYYNWYKFGFEQDYTPTIAVPSSSVEGAAQNDWTLAPFAQVDYKILPSLTLTGGIRFSTETKDFLRSPQQVLAPFSPGAVTISGKHTWTNFTYHAGANYRIDEHAMAYFSYSTGFKSGAFNSRAPAGTGLLPFDFYINPPAKPEKATAYEIGAKTDWFDNRLRANVAAFWNKYDDLQIQYFLPLPGAPQVLANGANQKARGVEVELTALPIDNLTLTGSIGYLDSRYTSFVANLGNQDFKPIACNNVTVDHAQHGPCYLVPYRSPLWTFNFTAQYDFHLPDDLGLFSPNLSWGHETSYMTDLNNSIMGHQPAFSNLDGSLNYTDPSGHFTVSVWAKNITNVVHKLAAVPSSNYFTQLYFAEPRTFGLQLNVHFDKEAN